MASISKEFAISIGHLLPHQGGKCEGLHGHNYKILVTLYGEPRSGIDGTNQEGMILDFGVLKVIVNNTLDRMDHRFVLTGDEWIAEAAQLYMDAKEMDPVERKDFMDKHFFKLGLRTTAETIAQWLAATIANDLMAFPAKVSSVGVQLFETDTSCAYAVAGVG